MPGENSVQQHSGDWTMTGKVPVARVRKHWKLSPAIIGRMSHSAHQDHGRIAGR
jgi:hypothetical protein